MNTHFNFYKKILLKLLSKKIIHLDDKILVCCGWHNDRSVLMSLGFTNVTIGNVDNRADFNGENIFSPYKWMKVDAENIPFDDNSYDWVIVHSGLHHLHQPLLGLIEMYRVAKVGILGFEPHLYFGSTMASKVGLGQSYELSAVINNNFTHGGVDNSEIPNHVFRFNKNLIIQVIRSFHPEVNNQFYFFYATRCPTLITDRQNSFSC